MKYFVAAIPAGFAVCYQRHNGQLVALSEHHERASATSEAQRLTLAFRLDQERAARRALTQHAMPRRPVRWFEPDAFA